MKRYISDPFFFLDLYPQYEQMGLELNATDGIWESDSTKKRTNALFTHAVSEVAGSLSPLTSLKPADVFK